MATLVLVALAGALLLAIYGTLKRDVLPVGLAVVIVVAALLLDKVL